MIHQALKFDPSIPDLILQDQLQKLIIIPLLALEESLRPIRVVIIDALDECDDPLPVITLIAKALTQHPGLLKFIITSRPEIYIQDTFQSPEAYSITQILSLRDFDAQDDISRFLAHRFAEIYQRHHRVMRNIPQPWPSQDIFDRIMRNASGLFIYASTILQFVDRPYQIPHRRLTELLDGQPTLNPESSPLDKLYTQVLSIVPRDYLEHLRIVVGTILLLFSPLSLGDLQKLLQFCLGPDEVVSILLPLYSILHISEDDSQPIRIYHESVYDFLIDIRRSHIYSVNPTLHHVEITRHCFSLMFKELKRDICGVGDPSKFNDEIADHECISGALRYACRYWARHLSNTICADFLECVRCFACNFILYWLEVLSLLGDLGFAIPLLRDATEWTQVCDTSSVKLNKFIIWYLGD